MSRFSGARALARVLRASRRDGTLLQTAGVEAPETLAGAYEVQDALCSEEGGNVLGWKIGATSRAARERLNVDNPVRGPLLADARLEMENGEFSVEAGRRGLRGIECEFAVMFGEDVPQRDEHYSAREVREMIVAAVPAIECVGSRFGGAKLPTPFLMADHGGNAAFAIDEALWQSTGPQSRNVAADMLRVAHPERVPVQLVSAPGGSELARGDSTNVYGSPLLAATWLVNHLLDWRRERGGDVLPLLRAGHIVLTGTCTDLHPAAAGDAFEVRLPSWGTLRIRVRE